MTGEVAQRWLFIGRDFASLPGRGKIGSEYRVLVEFREGLAGAWTNVREGEEVVTFGHPADSRNRWFRIFAVSKGKHNAASLALERMIFARRITTLVICDCSIEELALKGAAIHRPKLSVHLRSDGETLDGFLEKVFAA